MPRKPSEIIQVNLRMRERLRQRLEKQAKRHGVSLNYEMLSRIEQTFETENLRTLESIVEDQKNVWARYGETIHKLEMQGDLLRAVKALAAEIEKLPTGGSEGEPLKKAMTKVRQAVAMIEAEAAMLARRMNTTGSDEEILG